MPCHFDILLLSFVLFNEDCYHLLPVLSAIWNCFKEEETPAGGLCLDLCARGGEALHFVNPPSSQSCYCFNCLLRVILELIWVEM